MKNLLTINQLTKKQIVDILELARQIEKNPKKFLNTLRGKSLATLFFQPSTRTRISSSLAMQKLGGNVVDLYESKNEDGMSEPERFEDTIKVIGDYVDLICLRHDSEQAPRLAQENTSAKIINCGNDNDQHPTQALVDLYAIWKNFGRLNNLIVAIVGDLKNSRSAHSFFIAISLFNNNQIKLISPDRLAMPNEYIKTANNNPIELNEFEVGDEDVIYMAGLNAKSSDVKSRKRYKMNLEKAKLLKKEAIILSPLPRIDEIDREIDNFPSARYFQQSKDGLFVRMAIFIKLLQS